MKCGHNYCESCLITVRNGQEEWQCPETRQPHRKNIENLTRNYLVERFLDAYRKEQKEKTESCDDGVCDIHQRPFELCKFLNKSSLEINFGRVQFIFWLPRPVSCLRCCIPDHQIN